MAKVTKKAIKANEARVSKLYGLSCSGIQISIWDIGKVMAVGMAALNAGGSDEAISGEIRAFVETIRKN